MNVPSVMKTIALNLVSIPNFVMYVFFQFFLYLMNDFDVFGSDHVLFIFVFFKREYELSIWLGLIFLFNYCFVCIIHHWRKHTLAGLETLLYISLNVKGKTFKRYCKLCWIGTCFGQKWIDFFVKKFIGMIGYWVWWNCRYEHYILVYWKVKNEVCLNEK